MDLTLILMLMLNFLLLGKITFVLTNGPLIILLLIALFLEKHVEKN